MDMKRSILKHTPSTLCITNSTIAYSCVNTVTFCPWNFLRRSGVTKMLAQMRRQNQVQTWPFPAQWKLDVHKKLPPLSSALTLKNLTSSLTSTNYEGVGPTVQVGHLSPSCHFIHWLIHSCCRPNMERRPSTSLEESPCQICPQRHPGYVVPMRLSCARPKSTHHVKGDCRHPRRTGKESPQCLWCAWACRCWTAHHLWDHRQ